MKYEYRIEHLRTDKPAQQLNELGAEGWQLVSEFRPGSGIWIFMRAVDRHEFIHKSLNSDFPPAWKLLNTD